MTATITFSSTHSITYVADNILKSLKDIIRMSGLCPEHLVGRAESHTRAINIWLESEHLRSVVLEIYNQTTNKLIVRWDIRVSYGWSQGDGSFWTDTEQLKFAIKKAGVAPADARYRLILDLLPNAPDVEGWSDCDFRSTNGMVKQSLGSTVEHNGLGASTSYWRSAS